MEYIIAITFFAISSSITPGPNNIMVMVSSTNFGVRKTLPLLTGICVGFSIMLILVGVGFGQLFDYFPELHLIIKCIGTLYLLYLAWLIAQSVSMMSSRSHAKPLTFSNGALFQWVNAKAWIIATGAIATFTSNGDGLNHQALWIALIFLLVSFPCVGIWMMCGAFLKNVLQQPTYRSLFNYTMAILLMLSTIPAILDIASVILR